MKLKGAIVLALTFILAFASVQAGTKFINYQGVLIKNSVVVTTPTQVIFRIHEGELSGDNMWSEEHTVTPNSKGKFHVKLGRTVAFNDSVFNGNERWLSVEVDGQAMDGRTELGSVPFANLAHTVPDTAIGTHKIKKDAIVDSLIGEKEIGFNKIKNNAIVDSLIENNAIVDSLIKNKEIGHEKIRNKAIVDSLIANDAIVDSLIKNGSIKFEDIGQNGAQEGDVMKWGELEPEGEWGWILAQDQVGGIDTYWTLLNRTLFTSDEWGLARGGNTLNGLVWETHVNLGVDGTTGHLDKEYIYCTVTGGYANSALDRSSTVSGGESNVAGGKYSAVPGGRSNSATGHNSLAAGTLAKALHSGSIVIAANTALNAGDTFQPHDSVWTERGEQMVLRADSGFYLSNTSEKATQDAGGPGGNNSFLNTSIGAYLSSSGIWQSNSDMDKKENFSSINGRDILQKLARLSITEWNYKVDSDNVKHIGPVAQDFYSVFGIGENDKTIAPIDEAGIALAAIQELHKKVLRIEKLENELTELRELVDELLKQQTRN